MTARQVYEYMLVELNKTEAPSMLLEDFNYLFNKAIYQYINKKYNVYDMNQQSTDDVRVLKSTAVLTPTSSENAYGDSSKDSLYGGITEFSLPQDYLHLLNCICDYKVKKNFKCYNSNSHVQFGARRLTSDMWSLIINNFYMRPMYKRPYYFIHNVNSQAELPTNPIGTTLGASDPTKEASLPKTITINSESVSRIERPEIARFGNPTDIRLEIRWGKDNSIFELDKIYVDYIKTPLHIRLTQEQLDLTEDTSLIMEFPDYVCQEIINELVKLMMENASDPRLQTTIPINLTIALPAPQGQQTK